MKRIINKLITFSTVMAVVIYSSVVYGEELDQKSVTGQESPENILNTLSNEGTFKNPDEQMYYSVFGEGFELIQESSKQVNKTTSHDGLHMEILSTVSLQLEDVLRSYTFFTLQDETGDRVNWNMTLNLTDPFFEKNLGAVYAVQSNYQTTLLNFDETTQTATFVAEIYHNDYNSDIDTEYNNVSILIESILSNNIFVDENIDNVDITYLLDSHNATFTRNEITGSSIRSQFNDMGLDFETIYESDTLTKDELRIPMASYTPGYISNIALMDDMLHVQTNYVDKLSSWYTLDLVNTETGDIIPPLYTVFLDNYDEDFNLRDGLIYEEYVFLIQDVDNLSNYAFNLTGAYYDDFIETDLTISFLSPVLIGSITVNQEPTQVLISDEEMEINNIVISLLQIQFNLRSDEFLNEEVDISYMFDLISDNLDITLIYDDGTEEEYIGNNRAMSHWQDADFISVSVGGQIIDIDRLVAINVNGTSIEVR